MAQRKLLIIDPGFCQLSGHHLSTSLLLGSLCGKHGIESSLFASRKLASALRDAPGSPLLGSGLSDLHCCFSEIIYGTIVTKGAGAVARMEALGDIFAGELERFVEREVAPGTALFSHTGNAALLFGFALWLRRTKNPPDRVVINLFWLNETPAGITAYRTALRELAAFPFVRVAGGSLSICRTLQEYSGADAGYLPGTLAAMAAPSRNTVDYPVFCVAGGARKGKNF